MSGKILLFLAILTPSVRATDLTDMLKERFASSEHVRATITLSKPPARSIEEQTEPEIPAEGWLVLGRQDSPDPFLNEEEAFFVQEIDVHQFRFRRLEGLAPRLREILRKKRTHSVMRGGVQHSGSLQEVHLVLQVRDGWLFTLEKGVGFYQGPAATSVAFTSDLAQVTCSSRLRTPFSWWKAFLLPTTPRRAVFR